MADCIDGCGLHCLHGLRGIAFDCDGVMFDSWEANKAYYNTIRTGLGLEVMDLEMERYVHAHAVNESVARITPEGRLDEAQAIRRSLDYKDLIPLMVPEPGLVELLGTIAESGLKLAVFTNRTTTMELVLETFGLEKFFSPVITASKVPPKPDPQGMFAIMKDWGVEAHEMAFVGDSVLDGDASRAASVRFWAYKAPHLQADMHLSDFWGLRDLLLQSKS